MSDSEYYDHLFKIVLTGDSSVGKSKILSRYIKNEFTLESTTTIGVEFGVKNLKVWDTAGEEHHRALTRAYYRGAVGAIVVFDLTRQETFTHTKYWLEEVSKYAEPGLVPLLVGNKNDLKHLRTVGDFEANDFAESKNISYIETSALTSQNIEEAFQVNNFIN